MEMRELPNEGRESSWRVRFTASDPRYSTVPTVFDVMDDLERLAEQGMGDYEISIQTCMIRPHIPTEAEIAAEKLAAARRDYMNERRGKI